MTGGLRPEGTEDAGTGGIGGNGDRPGKGSFVTVASASVRGFSLPPVVRSVHRADDVAAGLFVGVELEQPALLGLEEQVIE